jgi:3-deoxy-D-manno-octulosonic-acid transferase
MRALYSLLLRVALPAQALRHAWQGWRSPASRGSLRAHLALDLQRRADRPLWLHAASVGEVQAMAPLVQRLRESMPGQPLLVTVGTATGLASARQRWAGPGISLLAAPWDLPGAARRFMRAVQPRAAVFIETELWPNLLHQASCAGCPLLLASARVSARSAARYQRWARGLMRETLRGFSLIGAQTDADRERLLALGARPGVVECWGNLKFDFTPPPDVVDRGLALRAQMAASRPMWVAGSTHAGEEEACLSAQRLLQDSARASHGPMPLLVIAPRRPERFEEVARLIVARGFSSARHGQPAPPEVDVVLVDRLGELLPYYAAADAAFVGGSLVPVGGHNLLEPAALGKPVLAGPHTGNAPEVGQRLESAGALVRVVDAAELCSALRELLGDVAQARRRGAAAAAVVAANRGATNRALEAISAELARQAVPDACPPAP